MNYDRASVSQVPQMNGNSEIVSRATPGMSGLWQVSGRSEMAFKQRVALDMYYDVLCA
jgi:lipopolysaccharide/colanic/teichoic acid biosynthesis glycosyltransferase